MSNPSSIRYPDLSEKLALLLYKRDVDMGFIEAEGVVEDSVEDKSDSYFVDTFSSDDQMKSYDIIDEKLRVTGTSCWYIKENQLHQSGFITQSSRYSGQVHARRGSTAVRRDSNFSNFELRVHFIARDGHPLKAGGVSFCRQTDSDYYLILSNDSQTMVFIYKVVSDVFYLLHQMPISSARNGVYCDILKQKTEFTITYSGIQIKFSDDCHPGGGIGIVAYDNSLLSVDFISCREISIFQINRYYLCPGYSWNKINGDFNSLFDVIDCSKSSFGSSNWGIDPLTGFLTQTSSISATCDIASDKIVRGGSFLLFKNCLPKTQHINISGYIISSDYSLRKSTPDDEGVGLVFNYISEENFSFLQISPCRLRVYLGSMIDGDIVIDDSTELKQSYGYPFKISLTKCSKKSDTCDVSAVAVTAVVGGSSCVSTSLQTQFHSNSQWGFLVCNNPRFACKHIIVESNERPSMEYQQPRTLRQLIENQREILQTTEFANNEIANLPSIVTYKIKQRIGRSKAT